MPQSHFFPAGEALSDFAEAIWDDYRLVVAVDFEKEIVWIKWIGNHKAYDKIDVTEVRHGD